MQNNKEITFFVNIYRNYAFSITLNWINSAVELYSWPHVLSHGSAATESRGSVSFNSIFLRRSFLNLIVKKLWKLVHLCQRYSTSKLAGKFWHNLYVWKIFTYLFYNFRLSSQKPKQGRQTHIHPNGSNVMHPHKEWLHINDANKVSHIIDQGFT